jgi:hypothetical protein
MGSYAGYNSQGHDSIALGNMPYLLGGYMQPSNTTLISKYAVRNISTSTIINSIAIRALSGYHSQGQILLQLELIHVKIHQEFEVLQLVIKQDKVIKDKTLLLLHMMLVVQYNRVEVLLLDIMQVF